MYKAFDDIVLLSAGDWKAAVLPDFGMNMVSLRCGEKTILREPDSRQTLKENPHVYGIPLLFPANRTEGGRFIFEGETYTLPLNEPQRGNHIHGLMFDAPFTVTAQTGNSVTAMYANHGERYPFPFVMEITDTLSETGVQRVLKLQNYGSGALPYTLAFHTTFTAPEMFLASVRERYLCDENYIPIGEMTELTDVEKAYRTGSAAETRRISGFYAADGHTAKLDEMTFAVSGNFDEWILFNAGGGQGFLCIEPQCGEVNGLNRPDGHRVLKPGETAIFTLYIGKEDAE